MAMAYSCGLMAQSTRACGKTTRLTDRENCTTQMEMSTRETGLMIRQKVKEPTRMLMAHFTKENGAMISSTVTALSHGLMERVMKATIKKGRRKGKEG